MQIACQAYWVGGGLAGVGIGAALPAPVKGLQFALCALFTVLTVDAVRSRREIPLVLLAGSSVTVALIVTPGVAPLTALLLFAALLLARHAATKATETTETAEAADA
jgi:predicted branched-subunit amino acid permease